MAKTKRNVQQFKKILQYDERERYLLMPNEAVELISKSDKLKGKDHSEHISVAYSYLYLSTWLYRYAKYGSMDSDMTIVKEMKNIIGVSPTGTSFDYIFKKGGVLDELGLTQTKSFTEAPMTWAIEEEDKEYVEFQLFNEMSKDLQDTYTRGKSVKRRQIKYPVLALEEREPIEDFSCNGTFFEGGKEYTHQISFEAFMKCMATEELGAIGFYLYSFIRSRYGSGKRVRISLEGIVRESGLKSTTVTKYMKSLREFGLVGAQVEDYVVGRDQFSNHKTEANQYWVYEKDFDYDDDLYVRKVVSVFNLDIKFTAEAMVKKEEIWKKTKEKQLM